jgi:hypothetical protein
MCSQIEIKTFEKISMVGKKCVVECVATDSHDNEFMVWLYLQECDRGIFKFNKCATASLPSFYVRALYHLSEAEEQFYKNKQLE